MDAAQPATDDAAGTHASSDEAAAHVEPCTPPTLPRGWLAAYVALLERRRIRAGVIFLWCAILAVGMVGVTRVFANLKLQARASGSCLRRTWKHAPSRRRTPNVPLTRHTTHRRATTQIEPIAGSENDLALKALFAAFPAAATAQTTTVLLQAADGATALATLPAARAAAAALTAFAAPYIADGLLAPGSGASYFTFADAGLAAQASTKLSPDGTAILVQYVTTEGYKIGKRFRDFLEALREELSAAVDASGGTLRGDTTGNLPINADSSAAITADIGQSDGVTVTLSFLLLALALRSLRLIMLTFVALCAAFGGAFLLTWPLTGSMSTPNFVTSLLISTLVSLSLDYSLFLLTHLKARMTPQLGCRTRSA
jgi:hypothetical protein